MGSHDIDDFQHDVIERSHRVPVLVDFWAEWCGPCRVLGPVLEKLADEADGWELAKLDTEAHPEIASRYGIRSIPCCKLFVDGEVADEFVGALPEPAVRQWLAGAVPGPERQRLHRARELLGDGEVSEAVTMLEEIVTEMSEALEARVLLARLVLADDPARARELVEPAGAGSEHGEVAEAIRTLADLLERAPGQLPESPVRDDYLAAIESLRRGEPEAALDGFIDVIARDRSYDDDGARRACLALFRLLGPDDPAVRERHTRFSSAVYA